MPCLGQTEVINRCIEIPQKVEDLWPAIMVISVNAPGSNERIRPCGRLQECLIIARTHWIRGFAHEFRMGFPPSKNIGHFESAIPQLPCAALASFHGWIVLNLGGFRRVQHDESEALACWVPDSFQAVPVAFAIRIGGGRHRIVDVVAARDHARVLPC